MLHFWGYEYEKLRKWPVPVQAELAGFCISEDVLLHYFESCEHVDTVICFHSATEGIPGKIQAAKTNAIPIP